MSQEHVMMETVNLFYKTFGNAIFLCGTMAFVAEHDRYPNLSPERYHDVCKRFTRIAKEWIDYHEGKWREIYSLTPANPKPFDIPALSIPQLALGPVGTFYYLELEDPPTDEDTDERFLAAFYKFVTDPEICDELMKLISVAKHLLEIAEGEVHEAANEQYMDQN